MDAANNGANTSKLMSANLSNSVPVKLSSIYFASERETPTNA